MKVSVQALAPFNCDEMIFDVKPSFKIFSLTSLIQDKQGISPECQVLTFNGQPLCKSAKLNDYGVREGDVLSLGLQLRGGCTPRMRCGGTTCRCFLCVIS